jgi:tripartite-type tricarboxylate transporter receptor subunit TctC
MAQAKGGKLRPIAITSPKRNPLTPDLPTLAEVLPGYDITAWFAIVAPANTPKPIVDKLHAATAKALASAEVRDKLAGIGLAPMPMTPEELSRFIVSEVDNWTRLTKEAGIEPE